jgi:hypothetical protein
LTNKKLTGIKRWIAVGILLAAAVTGCARTVTTDKTTFDELELTLQTRGTIDASQVQFFVLVSGTQTPQSPIAGRYFTAPGQPYSDAALTSQGTSLQAYYQAFFSTWDDYVDVFGINNAPTLYNGPFPANTAPEDHFDFTPNVAFSPITRLSQNQIQIVMPSGSFPTLTTSLYFTIVSTNAAGDTVLDVLEIPAQQNEKGAIYVGSHSTNSGIPAMADITAWRIRLF